MMPLSQSWLLDAQTCTLLRQNPTMYQVTKYLIHRHCAHFFLRVPSVCLGSNTEGSMVDTALELSDNSLQNCNYEVFCHIVLHRLARCRRWVGCCWWSCRPSPLLRVRGGGWLADWLAVQAAVVAGVQLLYFSPLPPSFLHSPLPFRET